MTEVGYGSPEATPCVKFSPVAFCGGEPPFRLLTLWMAIPIYVQVFPINYQGLSKGGEETNSIHLPYAPKEGWLWDGER